MTARAFARRLRVYDEVKAERDRLADELREIYPTTAALLAELLARIIANDQVIERINAHGLPRNHGRLLCAELAARGLNGWVKNWVQTPRITRETVLPSFRQGACGNLWPRWR